MRRAPTIAQVSTKRPRRALLLTQRAAMQSFARPPFSASRLRRHTSWSGSKTPGRRGRRLGTGEATGASGPFKSFKGTWKRAQPHITSALEAKGQAAKPQPASRASVAGSCRSQACETSCVASSKASKEETQKALKSFKKNFKNNSKETQHGLSQRCFLGDFGVSGTSRVLSSGAQPNCTSAMSPMVPEKADRAPQKPLKQSNFKSFEVILSIFNHFNSHSPPF